MDPIPLQESVLCSFVTYLVLQDLKHRTIKVYLLVVRHMQTEANLPDPFSSRMMKLEYVSKGVKREEAAKGTGSRSRLPITPAIPCKLK